MDNILRYWDKTSHARKAQSKIADLELIIWHHFLLLADFIFCFLAKTGRKFLNKQLMLISLSPKSMSFIFRIYENTGYM